MRDGSEDEFVLYSRSQCPSCDELEAALRALLADRPARLRVVDVDGDPALARRFGQRVPVLTFAGREVCSHRLDRAAVRACLADREPTPGDGGG